MKTKLEIYDFDGTIANVPERPGQHDDKRGWSGKDWWGSPQSLLPESEGGFYESSVNQEVVDAFKAAKADPNTDAIMLTGRRGIVAPYVRRILRANGLFGRRMIADENAESLHKWKKSIEAGIDEIHANESGVDSHEEYFVGDFNNHPDFPKTKSGSGTFEHKTFVIEKKMKEHQYKVIEIWDDRVDHIAMFKAIGALWVKQKKVDEFIIHQVFESKFDGVPATITRYAL